VTSHIPAGYWPQSYAYDEIGNSTWYFANNLNQYTEFGYDLDGNMITNYNTVMSYDAQSRLSSISTLVYTNNEWHTELLISNCYDHIGRRVKKITPAATHTFFYDGWNLIEERVAHTSGANTIIRYYWGKDLSGTLQGAGGVGGLLYLTVSTSNVEHQTSNSQLFIPCYDNNGNITRYLDSNGATVAQYTYDAFGNLLDKSGPLCDLFRQLFSTKYFDRETDLCYYGCRYYSPALMRWINRDPIGGQDSEANPYLFINNQATFDTDYLGMNSNTKMEATANQWHPLGTSTHEYHVWNCSEWPTYDGKQGGTYEKYVQHFSRVTFTMFYKVPADYKLYFAYGIPTTLEMDKKQSSYWCLDLKPFSVYWRHNNRKNAKEYKVTFTVTNFDRHPCLREHPNYLQSKFIGKTISYGPKP